MKNAKTDPKKTSGAKGGGKTSPSKAAPGKASRGRAPTRAERAENADQTMRTKRAPSTPNPVPKTIHSDAYKRLLDILVAMRRDADLTQRDLAQRLGVHHSWVAKVELGERRLDVIETIRLVRALEGDVVEVVREIMGEIE